MSKQRRTHHPRNVVDPAREQKPIRDDEALARNFFLATLAGIAVGGIGGWFYYGSQGATVGAVFGGVLGVGILFGYLSFTKP